MQEPKSLGLDDLLGLLGGAKDTVAAWQYAVVKDTVAAWQRAVGKEIVGLELTTGKHSPDGLLFTMADGTKLRLFDDGQTCCEDRYMTTDDDLAYFAGATLLGAEILEAPSIEDDYSVHEVQFLKVTTSKGVFTVETHNGHNGYYGGFAVRAVILDTQ